MTSGHLLGVISRSFSAPDGRGAPSGLYPQPVHLLDVDRRLLRLEGRDRVRVIDGNTYEYQVWFDR